MEATLMATEDGFLCTIPCRGQVDGIRVIGRDGLWYLQISVDRRKVEVRLPSMESRDPAAQGVLRPVLRIHTADDQAYKCPIALEHMPHFMPYETGRLR